ncbi:MAG: chemotaxis protein CheR [Planctomycetota bacterium]|nr:MAG: chemotaxis protein CheR [Planctomycetota bacterium]
MIEELKSMELSKEEFIKLRDYIHKTIGVLVDNDKEYLIKQRLEPVIKSFNLSGFSELCDVLKFPPIGLIEQITIAITTNETSFFRDKGPFDVFNKVLLSDLTKLINERKSKLFSRKGAKVKIWCVASSTGQEPYSLAMLINEYCENNINGVSLEDFSILATDINTTVLAQAIKGKYNAIEINRGLDAYRIEKYFRQENNDWIVNEKLQSIVEFRRLNLTNSFLSLGGFDLILCRNVLIYFDDKTKIKILEEIYQLLSAEGALILGSSENVYGLNEKFKSQHIEKTLLYKKH